MLTLYYASATFYQAWRIKNVCHKIAEQLALQSSVSFYALPAATDDGYDAALATSELCTNRNAAKVSDILWFHGNQRGCSLQPIQRVNIMPWITFPELPNWLPFEHVPSTTLSTNQRERLHLLLEMDIQPQARQTGDVGDIVAIENYGKLLAWKIDSHLAVLLETDIEHFTKLLIATFLQNNFLINDQLPLIRIESIKSEGKPQPFEMVSSHLRKPTRSARLLKADDWQKHLGDLRSLSVLANQATEFEYKKNRTEGKTGIIKPDLIPADKKEIDANEEEGKPNETKVELTPKNTEPFDASTSAENSPAKSEASISLGKRNETLSDKTVNLIRAEAESVATSSSNLSKLKQKPGEIKKPDSASTETKFKTAKVIESEATSFPNPSTPPSAPQYKVSPNSSPAKKTSELEKLAAASVTKKQNSATDAAKIMSNTATSTMTDSPKSIKTTKETAPHASKPGADEINIIAFKRDHTKANEPSDACKPLNILVYSESLSSRESVIVTLKDVLEKDKYTIYPLTQQQVEQKYWLDNTALLVVCGTVPSNIGGILVDFFLCGGKVLSLCSNILNFVLPTYGTAEVSEDELVQFSYDKWQKVKMMHHIFRYQPSPVKKNFSTDSDDSTQPLSRKPSLELKDLRGESHKLSVNILGTEETWQTPSLLLANSIETGGKAVFSQVHLEINPAQFDFDEIKFVVLKQNDKHRLEILADLLARHLEVGVGAMGAVRVDASKYVFPNAYFLGRHESKFELLEKLKAQCGPNNIITTSKLAIQFLGESDKPANTSINLLPILIHSCPNDFSTVDYFDNLTTNHIGRLVIYAPVVNSSMNVVNELELTHGIVVLPRQQTTGVGRSGNQWLSPLGCAMFSIQLHIPMASRLGARLPLMQHIVGLAMANALRSHNLYKHLDVSLKWPNDIYANGKIKIGGLIVQTTLMSETATVNIGCGINLANSKPTVCINDLITDYNNANKQNLPLLKYEIFLALIFNELERLIDCVQNDDFEYFYKLYYALWLHSDQAITICDKDGQKRDAKIIGIDDFGYLKVQLGDGDTESVQPDGNTFDMLKGLIVPKAF